LPIINCLRIFFPRNFPTFESIISAMLCLSGPKTMLNLSRWTELSYKTIERFYERAVPWLELNFLLFRNFGSGSEFLLVPDETTVNKSGKKTFGIDLFFSSLLGKTVKSLCFSGLAIIEPEKKRSYPLFFNQMVFTEEEKAVLKVQREKRKKSKGGKVGRPKGSKNSKKPKILAPSFRLLREQLFQCQKVIKLNLKYFVADGKYGNNSCVNICREFSYFLISKLQYNSALYFKYTGKYCGFGRPRIYGDKLDYKKLPKKYLVSKEVEKGVTTKIYQIKSLLNKSFDCPLNVVIVQKTTSKKVGHVLFFSTDLELSGQKIIDYYSARFQIEFNFRDAKEFWGLEDFMNIKENRVHNAANFAFFMVNLSNILLEKFRELNQNSKSGIRDLKASYRGEKYFQETLKLLQEVNPNILIPEETGKVTSMGHIHV